MRHATERALFACIQRAMTTSAIEGVTRRMACGERIMPGGMRSGEIFNDESAVAIVSGVAKSSVNHTPPTCPVCRVLIDAALEGKDLRALLTSTRATAEAMATFSASANGDRE